MDETITTISFDIEESLKREVDFILFGLGIPPIWLITSLYKQIAIKKEIPFDVGRPSKEEAWRIFFQEIEKSERSAEEKGYISLEDSKKAILGEGKNG